MRVAVRGDLVAAAGDPPHEVGMPLGHPAEHEERAVTPRSSKMSSSRSVLRDDAALHALPAATRGTMPSKALTWK